MKIIIYDGFWDVEVVRNHRDWLFVYGDNFIRYGTKGQACIRYEINSIGIATKYEPTLRNDAFFGKDFSKEKNIIIDDFRKLYMKFKTKNNKFEALVLPRNGLGTGLARLPSKAPEIFDFLIDYLRDFLKFLMCDDVNDDEPLTFYDQNMNVVPWNFLGT